MSSPTVAWPPPKSPLPPHRLAKLANALGISTPLPAVSQLLSSSSSLPDQLRRSPTPSSPAAPFPYPSAAPQHHQPTSKFLLHVIPPHHLPHDLPDTDSVAPPPPNASGYHAHFRRGTLVPVHSTLQSQLSSIAKEYALPSTAGLVLYLISSNPADTGDDDPRLDAEPGPRLSEEIWRHIWSRVLKAERDDFPSRSPTPLTLSAPGMVSSPSLLTHTPSRLLSSSSSFSTTPVPPPIPSSPSTLSDLRIQTGSAPASSSSLSQSDTAETPDTSLPSESRANSFDLPGLKSPQLIPVLAKVEFDIDKRKAGWYEPWCRSRRVNHAKRAESRAGRNRKGSEAGSSIHSSDQSKQGGPLDLKLVKRMQTASPVSFLRSDKSDPDDDMMYERLADEDSEDEDDLDDENSTARIVSVAGKDPLSDVFGSDADTWAELRRESRRTSNLRGSPRIVDLALTGQDLENMPEGNGIDADIPPIHDEEDVKAILRKVGSPPELPSSPPSFGRSNSMRKKPPPPPITIEPIPIASPMRTASSADGLAYLNSSSPDERDISKDSTELDEDFDALRSADSEKRTGGVYDDFDLGLDDIDEDDPTDRRRSQFLMKAELDKIEQNLAQFSPRPLGIDLEKQQSNFLASPTFGQKTLSPRRNADVFPPSPRLPRHPELDSANSPPDTPMSSQAAWPAVPYSALNAMSASQPSSSNSTPAPPQLAVNGVTTSAPKAYMDRRSLSASNSTLANTPSSESAMRKREQEELQASYPQSPIIPLSPDPFSRFSGSLGDRNYPGIQSTSYWSPERAPPLSKHQRQGSSKSQSSRFSADSFKDEDVGDKAGKGGGLGAVKSIKKLWRKSNKNSVSSLNAASGGAAPPMPSLAPPPARKGSNDAMPSPPPGGGMSKRVQLAPPAASPGYDRMSFDQETPYPIPRRSPTPQQQQQQQLTHNPHSRSQSGSPIPPTPLSPVIETHEKPMNGTRKSILKSWKSSASLSSSAHSPRSSISESNNGHKPRRPSIFGSGASSSTTSLDVPPSPALPSHNNGKPLPPTSDQARRTPGGGGRRNPSVDSTSHQRQSSIINLSETRRPSVSSSGRASEESRPSFDVSQFEIVSPKMGSTLSYPYHTLDHSS